MGFDIKYPCLFAWGNDFNDRNAQEGFVFTDTLSTMITTDTHTGRQRQHRSNSHSHHHYFLHFIFPFFCCGLLPIC